MKTFIVVTLLCVTFVATYAQHSEEEGNLFEGDLILTPDQMSAVTEQDSKKTQGFAAIKSNHWKTNEKNDVIKYFIQSSLSGENNAVKAITDAIGDYHKYTCIRFQRVYSKPSGPHISFFKGGGCYSYVGKMTRIINTISLGFGCWYKGTAMHEIGHSLGFFHEQSRPDRDNYVKILTSNVKPDFINNFNKYKTSRIDSLNSPYDYESMMHYGKNYFKKSAGLITIQTLDPKYQNVIGQRNGFSQEDIRQFNKMYNCPHTPTGPSVTPPSTPTTRAPITTTITGCFDKPGMESNCQRWKIICDDSYVQENCRRSCNLCSGPSLTTSTKTTTRAPSTTASTKAPRPSVTTSTKPTTRAPSITVSTKSPTKECADKPGKEAFCNRVKSICSKNTYVRENCQLTCNLCGVTPTEPTTSTKPTTRVSTTTTSTKAPTKRCIDKPGKETFCNNVKIICSSNTYVQDTCPLTCNLCGTVTVDECKDESASCTRQAMMSLCSSNLYIQNRCRKTCKMC